MAASLRAAAFLWALALTSVGASGYWQNYMTSVAGKIKHLQIPYDYDKCLARSESGEEIPSLAAKRTGVVVVYCDEDLSAYDEAGCRDGHVQFYVYSKCGQDREQILPKVPNIRKCVTVKTVAPSAYTHLTGAEQHSEYLEHIVRRYGSLEDWMIFTSATEMSQNPEPLLHALENAAAGSWDYKPLPHAQRSAVRFGGCSNGAGHCSRGQLGRELCALYKRYTCEADCYSCPADTEWLKVPAPFTAAPDRRASLSGVGLSVGVSRCFVPVPGSSFLVSRGRLQEAPVNEYMWLREWLLSWQEDAVGVPRREAAELMWPALLGCPEDIHQNSTAFTSGCLRGSRFPIGSSLDPPHEMVDDGLVHWASLHSSKHVHDPNRHSSKSPYPHLLSPKYGSHRRITFVATFGASSPSHVVPLLPLVKAAFGSVLLHHPSARFVLLVKDDVHAIVSHRLAASHGWFAKRLEIHPVKTEHGATHGSGRGGSLSSPLPWEEAHASEMLVRYLHDTVSRSKNPEISFGHIAVTGLNSVLLEPVWDVFKGHEFTIATPVLPASSPDALDTRTIFIHRSRIRQAAALLSAAFEELELTDAWGLPIHRSFSAALRDDLLWCQSDEELREVVSAQEARAWPTQCVRRQFNQKEAPEGDAIVGYEQKQSLMRNAVETATHSPAAVRLLRCGTWGSSTSHPEDEGGEACRMDPTASKLVHIEPPDGDVAWGAFTRMVGAEGAVAARAFLAAGRREGAGSSILTTRSGPLSSSAAQRPEWGSGSLRR